MLDFISSQLLKDLLKLKLIIEEQISQYGSIITII